MSYPGGKAGDGVYQKIINQMPPHRVYIEPFLGGGGVFLHKRPAQINVGLDIDESVISAWRSTLAENSDADVCIVKSGDAISFLRSYDWSGGELVYCDPPYLMSVRSYKDRIYTHEFSTEQEHTELLALLKTLPCCVMVSGYWSELYADLLATWRFISFRASTRGGPRTEFLWMNYPEPFELHDYRYLGETFRERERIKRKKNRWSARLVSMPSTERYAIMQAIEEAEARAGITKSGVAAVASELTMAAAHAISADGGHPHQK